MVQQALGRSDGGALALDELAHRRANAPLFVAPGTVHRCPLGWPLSVIAARFYPAGVEGKCETN